MSADDDGQSAGGASQAAETANAAGALGGVDEALERAAELIRSGKAKHVVVLAGAGISTSAGIPDFRSPSTGLYANLARLNLPYPEAVFSLDYFERRPEPFWALAKELYPGKHFPTPTHYFFAQLHARALLARVFTQNIDTLESAAGLPAARVVEAHGSFAAAHCLGCRRAVDRGYVLRAGVRRGEVVRCACGGLVKPDIVFFGEALPEAFFQSLSDLTLCDLLIVVGTSLQVQPFASLVNYVRPTCPRLLINREAVGPFARAGWPAGRRDGCWLGDCDDGVQRLAALLGWTGEMEERVRAGREELERAWAGREEGAEAGAEEADEAGPIEGEARDKEGDDEDEEDEVEKDEESDTDDEESGEDARRPAVKAGDDGGGDGQAGAAQQAAKAGDAVQAAQEASEGGAAGTEHDGHAEDVDGEVERLGEAVGRVHV